MDGAVAGVGVLVDLAMADALETSDSVQSGPEAADPGEHIKIAYQVDLISFLLQGEEKAEDILIPCPACVLPAFFCCQIQMAQFFPMAPDGGQQGVLFMGLTDHPAARSVSRSTGMELRMRQASRCWGDVEKKKG